MTVRRSGGMLSNGVLLPDSMFIGIATSMIEQAELRHGAGDGAEEDADGGGEEQVERRRRQGTAGSSRRSARRAACAPRTPSDTPTATVMTRPLAQTFDIAISNGVSGMTSRWSIVPCSRSRITAAPARMIASMVTLLITPMTLVNQDVVTFGLKAMRTCEHRLAWPRGSPVRETKLAISRVDDLL